jgi:DNA polymerase elongation subunit (family B)
MASNDDLIFQIIDWQEYNEKKTIELEGQIDYKTKKTREVNPMRYFINLFGRTADEKSVCLRIEDFRPYFFIEIPEDWKTTQIDNFIKTVNNLISSKKMHIKICSEDEYDENGYGQVEYKKIMKHKMRGFTAGKLFPFIVFFFQDSFGFKNLERIFLEDISCPSGNPYTGRKKFQIYESNIEPYIRFNHIINTDTCGWVKVTDYELEDKNNTDIYAVVNYSNVKRYDTKQSAKFRILSWDIECYSHDGGFPTGDNIENPIIQIGCVFQKYGEPEPYKRVMLSLNSCDKIDGVIVECFDNEKDLLLGFKDLILDEDPDILTGYNIFGFDYSYIYDRVKLFDIEDEFSELNRHMGVDEKRSKYLEKSLSSSALGDNILKFFEMKGRVQIDLLKVVQRDHKLDSYKLDRVAENFINQDITKFDNDKVYVKNPKEFMIGNFIEILENDEIEGPEHITDKIKILNINYEEKYLVINKVYKDYENLLSLKDKCKKYKISLVKDDIHPDDIFKKFKGNSADRKIIAEYCIQDCVLVLKLLNKLQVITNNTAMANVCSVPLSYIFLRGQGVKIFSLVAKYCRMLNFVVPLLKVNRIATGEEEEAVGYEGAIVFDPTVGFYKESVWVNDYSSLYPSSMIATNISHETIVIDPKYRNLDEYEYKEITFKNNDGSTNTCMYAKKKDPTYDPKNFGILPQILMNLLGERKATRKLIETEKDPFVQSILDGKQLALKVTANSLYGQLGAKTSPIFMLELAASTTAVGRKQLELARTFVEKDLTRIMKDIHSNLDNPDKLDEIFNKVLKDKMGKPNLKDRDWVIESVKNIFSKYTIKPETLYGDTDSVFNRPNFHDLSGKPVSGPETIMPAVILGQLTSKLVQSKQQYPQELSYEKVFCPWIIVSKKRYIGKKYEEDDVKYKVASMGLVLKRRDNAPIVKKVVGGLLKKWMIDLDEQAGIDFIRKSIYDIVNAKYPIRYYVTSKTLKGKYKGKRLDGKHPKGSVCTSETKKCECSGPWPWKEVQCGIAHVTLCQRMAERDPGNEPATNERIPYVAVEINDNEIKNAKRLKGKEEKILQGDKIEHPDYIQKHKLNVDYKFYLNNQIMNPTVQFLEIVMDNPQKMFMDEIKKLDIKHSNEMDQFVFKKIGMKQNDLGSYFKKKVVVYEEEDNKNVYSEGEDNKNVYSESGSKSGSGSGSGSESESE